MHKKSIPTSLYFDVYTPASYTVIFSEENDDTDTDPELMEMDEAISKSSIHGLNFMAGWISRRVLIS